MSTNQKGLIFGVVGLVTILAGWVALVYGLLGYFDAGSQRIISAAALAILWPGSIALAVFLTRRLMRGEIAAHDRGMDKGLDKVTRAASDVATIRTAMHTTIKSGPVLPSANPGPRGWDDLLPARAVIFTRQDDDTAPLEM